MPRYNEGFFQRFPLIPRTNDNVHKRSRLDAMIRPMIDIFGGVNIEQEYAWLNGAVERRLRRGASGNTEGSIFLSRAIPSAVTRRVEIHPYFREEEQTYLQVSLPFPHQKSEDRILTAHSAAVVLEYDNTGSLVAGIAQPEPPTHISLSDYLTVVDKRKGITLDKAIANNLQSLIPLIASADQSTVAEDRRFHHELFASLRSEMSQTSNFLHESPETVDERARRAQDKTTEVLRDIIGGLQWVHPAPFSILESSGFVDATSARVFNGMITLRQGENLTDLVKKEIQFQLESFIKYTYYNSGLHPRDILKFVKDPHDADYFLCSLESRVLNSHAKDGLDTEIRESHKQIRVGYNEPVSYQGVTYTFQKSHAGDVLSCTPQTSDAIRGRNKGWRAVFLPQVPTEAMDTLLNRSIALPKIRRTVERDLGAKIS